MIIENPKANLKDVVLVRNYKKRDDCWENGVVIRLSYENSFGFWNWYYTIRLLRTTNKNKHIILTVNNSYIK
jgi:hypothetical protein